MADKLDRILSELESGSVLGIDDLEVLAEANDGNPIVEFLFGSGSSIVDSLSDTAKATLDESIQAQGDKGIVVSRDLGLVLDEPFFGGPAKATITAAGGAGPGVVGKTVKVTSAASKSGLGRAVFTWMRNHKLLTGLGIAGAGFWSIGSDDDPTTQAVQTATAPDQDILGEQPNDFIVIDPATGQQVPLSQLDPGLNASVGVQESFGGSGSFSSELQAFAQAQGLDISQLGLAFGGIEQINPLFFGEQRVNESDFPSGVDVRGQALPDPQSFINRRRDVSDPQLQSLLPGEDYAARSAYGVVAPPGAQLNPAFFREITPASQHDVTVAGDPNDRGEYIGPNAGYTSPSTTRTGTVTTPSQTLSTAAAGAAGEFGVPIDILYGVINATSGWNPKAVGNAGTTYGLGQIEEGFINRNAAQDPTVALRYVARSLASDYQRYGAWELAALNYHEKGAADKLIAEGTIDKTNKDWLGNALESSAKSGLGNNIFDFAGLAATPTSRSGSGGGGPKIPAFQEPDKATLREISRRAVESVYGRTTENEELEGFVDQLMAGYKEAYEQSVIQLQGGQSVQVDPQAQLIDQLRGSGEGQFRVERDQQRSMMDNVGDWARILQEA